MEIVKSKFEGIFFIENGMKKLLTRNITPGLKFFDEELYENGAYRQFDHRRSKLAAAIMKGLSQWPFRKDSVMLYLGASHGYTCSFLSDILHEGLIFAIDFAPRVVRDLVFLAEQRKNIGAILADANNPYSYLHKVSQADIVYQDVAQRNQAEIFLKNCRILLKPEGFGFIAVKARSVDVTKKPKIIFKETREMLEKELVIVDYKELEPFEKAHAMFVCKKKNQ